MYINWYLNNCFEEVTNYDLNTIFFPIGYINMATLEYDIDIA